MKNINEQFEKIEFDDFGEVIDRKTLRKSIAIGALCGFIALFALFGILTLIIELWHS